MMTVHFSETMTGFAALGYTDPEEGYERGKEQMSVLALKLDLRVNLDDRVVAPANPRGTVSGIVTFAPLGSDMSVMRGAFELFAVDELGRHRMDYRLLLGLRPDRSVTCSGFKALRPGDVMHIWEQTTTLPIRFYDGDVSRKETGTSLVLGAGIVHLSLGHFVREFLSLHAEEDNLATSAHQTLRFMNQFAVGLGAVYFPMRNPLTRCR